MFCIIRMWIYNYMCNGLGYRFDPYLLSDVQQYPHISKIKMRHQHQHQLRPHLDTIQLEFLRGANFVQRISMTYIDKHVTKRTVVRCG
mgnify:CR=1 FL=1